MTRRVLMACLLAFSSAATVNYASAKSKTDCDLDRLECRSRCSKMAPVGRNVYINLFRQGCHHECSNEHTDCRAKVDAERRK